MSEPAPVSPVATAEHPLDSTPPAWRKQCPGSPMGKCAFRQTTLCPQATKCCLTEAKFDRRAAWALLAPLHVQNSQTFIGFGNSQHIKIPSHKIDEIPRIWENSQHLLTLVPVCVFTND